MKSKTYRLVPIVLATILTGLSLGAFAASTVASRDRSFDSGWRFLRADAPGAETSAFDDSTWRTLDVPHDWSIEDLPPLEVYVTVEVVDQDGNRVPNVAIPIHFTVAGAGELTSTGNGAPNDPASFRAPIRKTCEGRCLAILRPNGGAGKIELKAEADGLKPATVVVQAR